MSKRAINTVGALLLGVAMVPAIYGVSHVVGQHAKREYILNYLMKDPSHVSIVDTNRDGKLSIKEIDYFLGK